MKDNKKSSSLAGVVVANYNKNTVTVLVSGLKSAPLYHKKYKVSKKYSVDCQKKLAIGDLVEIVSVRPISKSKKYKVLEK